MKTIYILLFLVITAFAQEFLIEESNPVINFLQRMKARGILSEAESFAFPVHRYSVAEALQSIDIGSPGLTEADRGLVNFYLSRFVEGDGFSRCYVSGEGSFLSDKQSYFYYSDTDSMTLGINIKMESNAFSGNLGRPGFSVLAGGLLSGSYKRYFTFNLQGMNGIFSGDKNVVRSENRYNSNFKLQDTPEGGFYDETSGSASLYNRNISITLARSDFTLGYGTLRPLVNNLYPRSDFINLRLNIGILEYAFLHGTLLGPVTYMSDSITGGVREIPEKFIVYHTVGFRLGEKSKLQFGEMAIYSGRGMDLGYLNPFNFYKTVEHSRIDRDNTAIFAGFETYAISNSHIFFMLYFDDIDYGKLGSGWWGNQVLFHTGASYFTNVNNFPVDIHAEFMEIQPYVFSHRLKRNSFTNLHTPVSGDFEPNSVVFSATTRVWWHHNSYTEISGAYSVHGDNEYDNDGNLMVNYGGRVGEGHRTGDSEYLKLLDGVRENIYRFSGLIGYDPYENLSVRTQFTHKSAVRASKTIIEKLFTLSLLFKL